MPIISSNTTAILIFARSSTEEMRHKKLPKGQLLFDALTKHTLKTVEKTGLPYFHISEEAQKGNSFGERFTNAIQDVFDQGYLKIITVGNDSPHLNKGHIEKTIYQLENRKSVIGPSADGGFYLMGLHRSSFKKSDFEKLSWQTSNIWEEVNALLSISGKQIYSLPVLFDIDTFWDIKVIAKHISGLAQEVSKVIRSIVFSDKKIKVYTFSHFQRIHLQIPSNKGSPFTFSS